MRVESGDPPTIEPQSWGETPGSLDRLALQLNTLTEVVETLTYRLLELEESLAVQQSALEGVCRNAEQRQLRSLELTEVRLDDTEQRLSRVEGLLQKAAPMPVEGLGAGSRVGGLIDAPFGEEGEQPFMDDWSDAVPA